MNTQLIFDKYILLLKKYGIDVEFIAVDDAAFPAQEIKQDGDHFTVLLNPSKFLPDLSYESYAAYNAKELLLPRLVLETERLVLRRVRMEDSTDCFAFLSDEKGMYLDCCKPFTSMDEAFRERMELFMQRESQYVIILKDSGAVIGTVNVFDDNSRAVDAMELGYAISPAHQRKGYAFEALSALIGLLQRDLQLDMLVAGVLEENTPSIRLLEKLGFRPEGLRHKAAWHEGLNRPVDLQYYYLDKT